MSNKELTEAEYEEYSKKISDAVERAYAALKEAEKLSLESGIEFNFSPAYGMGGYFDPESEDGWRSSSQDC